MTVISVPTAVTKTPASIMNSAGVISEIDRFP